MTGGTLIGEHEAARLLSVSVKTLRRWRWRCPCECPPWIKIGAAVRYDVAALEEYIARQTREAAPVK
jgi:Helix-turn-helix domain